MDEISSRLTDEQIVSMYFDRDPRAIHETLSKYEKLCMLVADGILKNLEDAEECISDVMLSLWNGIPPAKPESLRDYLIKAIRMRAYITIRHRMAQKRGCGTADAAFDELGDFIQGSCNTESEADYNELTRLLEKFIEELPEIERFIFIRRIWFMNSVKDIAKETGFTESKVKSMLHRIRGRLRKYLHDSGGYLYEEI